MSKNTKVTIATAVLASSVLLSGCGLFGIGEKKEIDPPQDVSYLEEGEALEIANEAAEKNVDPAEQAVEETVKTELYLFDKNGYVVPQTLSLPKTESVAKQALEYLVENGPITNLLPNGFKAVLPADTTVLGVNIKDGVATADFSPEFKNYQAENEMKILQAVSWTLTQFDSVEKVKIRINGHDQTEMPVNGTPISNGISRNDGINVDVSRAVDITNTRAVTVYYLGQDGDNYYYVPVTKRISNEENNNITAAINELINGPSFSSNLFSSFGDEAKLIEEPKVENGKVTLNFNEAVYGSFEEKMISKQLLDSLVLSLTEQKGIESVAVLVNGKSEIVNEEGKQLSEPVNRPENVNTTSF